MQDGYPIYVLRQFALNYRVYFRPLPVLFSPGGWFTLARWLVYIRQPPSFQSSATEFVIAS